MFDKSSLDLDGEDLDREDLDDGFDDWDDPEERHFHIGTDDGESILEELARLAPEIEAGCAEVPPGWKFDRPAPEILVWTTPAGRRFASTLTGEPVRLPYMVGGEPG
jgi:hypothetical protein